MAMTEASTSASREKDAVDVEASVGGHGKRLLVLEKKRGRPEMAGGCVITAKERISRMAPCVAGKRSSIYRGVTRHRWTGRYEAHLWDKSTWNENQNKKGKQVYLGAYDDEEAAGRAYDLAALKFWGPGTLINFPVSDYSRDLEEMQLMSKEEYLASLRRKSSAFSKGFPRCRAMPRVPENSQWETSLSYVLGTNRDAKTKIDLSSLLNWWGPRNAHQLDTSDMLSKNLEAEIRALESSLECTQPYKFPYLARPNKRIPQEHGASASDVLAQSSSFKNLKKYVESHDYYEEITEKNCQTMLEPSLAVGAVGLADGFDLYACDSLEQEPDYLPWEKLPLQEKARDEGDCERTARKP